MMTGYDRSLTVYPSTHIFLTGSGKLHPARHPPAKVSRIFHSRRYSRAEIAAVSSFRGPTDGPYPQGGHSYATVLPGYRRSH
jgi:hypothetical protein